MEGRIEIPTVRGHEEPGPAPTWREKQGGPRERGMTRRQVLKGLVGGISLVVLAASGDRKAGQVLAEVLSEESRGWQYTVREGDTMDGIGRRNYPDFDDNQPRYRQILRQANYQNLQKNLDLFPGQKIWIPDPQRPTYGLGLEEEVLGVGFKGVKEIDGKKVFQLTFMGEEPELPQGGMKVGEEFVAPKNEKGELVRYRLVAYLPGMPYYKVPGRVVFEKSPPPPPSE